MSEDLEEALYGIEEAAGAIFDRDPAVYAVGIGYRRGARLGYVASRDRRSEDGRPDRLPLRVRDFPVLPFETDGHPTPLAFAGSSQAPQLPWPEQGYNRPLFCGVEIQNFDDAKRLGVAGGAPPGRGSLGCLVRLQDNRTALLSNRHVLAPTAFAAQGDAIYQPASGAPDASLRVALLHECAPLQASPKGATFAKAHLNEADAAIAVLDNGIFFKQNYLPGHALVAPNATAVATLGDRVNKVGRSTGPTAGYVTQVAVVVKVPYGNEICWFWDTMIIEGEADEAADDDAQPPFAEGGDSGSVVTRDDGAVVGLLFSGSPLQSFACPIDAVLQLLKCRLA